jgi:hypothetical protein
MRAGPLSNKEVIELLNSYFVPVTVSNEAYKEGKLTPQEHAWLDQWKVPGGVSVSIIQPDGTQSKYLHVAKASTLEILIPALKAAIEEQHISPGAPAFPPRPQSVAPEAEPGALVMHLTARGDENLTYPAETWIVFSPADVSRMLPSEDPKPGTTWTIDKEISARILVHIYPQAISSDHAQNNVFGNQQLTGRVLSVTNGVVRARLDGLVTMKRSYYPQPNPQSTLVVATLAGFVDFALHQNHVHAIKLATYKATSDGQEFDVVLTSTPHRYAEPVEK